MNKETNIKVIESLINEILPGLSMYVRDVNLLPEIAVKFEVAEKPNDWAKEIKKI